MEEMFGVRSIVAQGVSGAALGLLAVFGPGLPKGASHVYTQPGNCVAIGQHTFVGDLVAQGQQNPQDTAGVKDNRPDGQDQDLSGPSNSDAMADGDSHDIKYLDVTHHGVPSFSGSVGAPDFTNSFSRRWLMSIAGGSAPQQSGAQGVSFTLDSGGSGVVVNGNSGLSHTPVSIHGPHFPVGIISPPPIPPHGICPTPLPSPLLMSTAGLAIVIGLVFCKRKQHPAKV
jgi:hypothetical protein